MITIKEVANLAGVSPTTVSNVIHGHFSKVSQENIDHIQKILKENNYIQRMDLQALATGKSKIIAVVIQVARKYDETVLGDYFHGIITGSVEEEIRKLGYSMFLFIEEDIDIIARTCLSWNVAGTIAIGLSYEDYQKLQSSLDCPLVGIDVHSQNLAHLPDDGYYVGLDDYQSAYDSITYLYDQGFRNFIYVYEQLSGSAGCRMHGAKAAMERLHLPVLPHTFIHFSFDKKKENEIINTLKSFTGKDYVIVCTSDRIALEILLYSYSKGFSIPDDISIMGFDDSTYAKFNAIGLTTIRQNIPLKGQTAVQLLYKLIQKEPVEKKCHILPTKLIERASLRPPVV